MTTSQGNRLYRLKLPEVHIFMGAYFFAMNSCFRIYSPLALEVYNKLFIGSSGFMAIDRINKHMFGRTQSRYAQHCRHFCLTLRVKAI